MDEYFECKIENDYFYSIYDQIMAEYDDAKSLDENFSYICSILSDYEYSEYLQSCKALALIKAYRDFGGKVEITNEQIERIKQLDYDGLVELNADDIFLSKRKAYLDKFFVKMLKPCAKPKAKRKRKLDFKKGDCIYNIYEGKYIIGVVLEENHRTDDILVALFMEDTLCPVENLFDKEPIMVGWTDGLVHILKGVEFCYYPAYSKIKVWQKIKIEKNNISCGKGIHFNYLYFDSNALELVKEKNQYDGFEVCINENHECRLAKEHPCWGWKHITAPDYKYLKDYII